MIVEEVIVKLDATIDEFTKLRDLLSRDLTEGSIKDIQRIRRENCANSESCRFADHCAFTNCIDYKLKQD